MNILIIPSFLFTNDDRTLGSFIFEQAIALTKAGNNVYILYCDTFSLKYFDNYINYSELEFTEINGVKIYRKKTFCPLKCHNGVYGIAESFSKSIISLFNKHLSNIKFDIIHAHCCVWAGYAAMKLSQSINVPYVITEHSSMFALDSIVLHGNILSNVKHSFKEASRVICVSQGLKNYIKSYTDNIEIIGNVVDCDLFNISQNDINQNEKFSFFTIFYMKNEAQVINKGVDLLISAFKLLIERCPNCVLKIAGEGASKPFVQELIQSNSLQSNVFLLGELNRNLVAKEMQSCNVFVLPSRYETFGVSYAEAMACGKPVIGTYTGGPDTFVDENSGILVPINNIEALLLAMEKIINNYNCYDPNVIRKKIVDQYSMSSISKYLNNLYKEVRDDFNNNSLF